MSILDMDEEFESWFKYGSYAFRMLEGGDLHVPVSSVFGTSSSVWPDTLQQLLWLISVLGTFIMSAFRFGLVLL